MTNSRGKRSPYTIVVGIAGAVLALVFAGTIAFRSGAEYGDIAPAATVQMTNSLEFRPSTVRIRAGQTVTWRNTSQVAHSVTADPGLAADRSHVRLPAGASTFNAANVAPGKSYARSFKVPGEYRYFCIPHEGQGMIGTIVVTE